MGGEGYTRTQAAPVRIMGIAIVIAIVIPNIVLLLGGEGARKQLRYYL